VTILILIISNSRKAIRIQTHNIIYILKN